MVPPLVYWRAYAVFVGSVAIVEWAKFVNQFFSTVVRLQTERGHHVVDRGPYGFVRHPGYLGGILMAISSPVVLGSYWALVPAAAVTVLILVRTCLEDRTLHGELPGYEEYTRRVRYRILPSVW
ncbi:MAG: methyltransferase family protein [Bacillota bacterium]